MEKNLNKCFLFYVIIYLFTSNVKHSKSFNYLTSFRSSLTQIITILNDDEEEKSPKKEKRKERINGFNTEQDSYSKEVKLTIFYYVICMTCFIISYEYLCFIISYEYNTGFFRQVLKSTILSCKVCKKALELA